MLPSLEDIQRVILEALKEDVGQGDITSGSVIAPGTQTTMQMVAREPLRVAGMDIASMVFLATDNELDIQPRCEDGQDVAAGDVMMSLNGSAHSIFTAERTALNILQRMCGIATATVAYSAAIAGTGAVIIDTRKTVPGLRSLDKYAVTCGGGFNHRMRLDDAVLIKDNHIAVVGSVKEAVHRARSTLPITMQVQAECDTLEQVKEALEAGADAVLLDNMSLEQLREAVALVNGQIRTEASGGITLETVRSVAETGVNTISVGALTHSVRAADIGLDDAG